MTKQQIIAKLSKEKTVEKFICNTSCSALYNELKDLSQDIYQYLLEYDDEKIIGMYERDELEYFIARMICNQYRSLTSPFYTKYRKFLAKSNELTEGYNNKMEENEDYRWMTRISRKNSETN